jgi:hypothetical protein
LAPSLPTNTPKKRKKKKEIIFKKLGSEQAG